MIRVILPAVFVFLFLDLAAQDTTSKGRRNERKEERRQKVNALIRQAEEGVLIFNKQSIFGIQLRTNGYGGFFEYGRLKTNRKTNIYRLDLTEIKHSKEEKLPDVSYFLGNPYIYGKINNFYQLTLGFGQQYILGQKGNKNGVAMSAVYNAGLAIGILRPYYLEVEDSTGELRTIKYSREDSVLFTGNSIHGGGGFGKGWGELKFKPGAFAKLALRFDYGRFNEVVSGIEAGVSLEAYATKIPIMLMQKDRQLFFQGYVAILFGRRR